ncbi:MAG: hypothetical protein ABFD89_02015 [Bryobacteraceae bacterium]
MVDQRRKPRRWTRKTWREFSKEQKQLVARIPELSDQLEQQLAREIAGAEARLYNKRHLDKTEEALRDRFAEYAVDVFDAHAKKYWDLCHGEVFVMALYHRVLERVKPLLQSLDCNALVLPVIRERLYHWRELSRAAQPPEDSPSAQGGLLIVPVETPVVAALTREGDAGERCSDGYQDGPRGQVNRFIDKVLRETGRRISRTDIWRVVGYSDRTEFQRFQRGRGASPGSIRKITKVLNLNPAEFLRRLATLKVQK